MFKSYPDITILAGLEFDVFANIEKNNGKSLLIQNKTASVPAVVRGRSSTDNSGVSIVNYSSVTVLNSMVSGLYIKNTGYTPVLISITEIEEPVASSEGGDVSGLTDRVVLLESEYEALNSTVTALNDKVFSLTDSVTGFDVQLQDANGNITQLLQNQLGTDQSIVQLQTQIDYTNKRLDELDPAGNTDYVSRLEDLETKATVTTQTTDSLINLVSKNIDDIANNSQSIQQNTDAIMALQDRDTKLEERVSTLEDASPTNAMARVVRFDNYGTQPLTYLTTEFVNIPVSDMVGTGNDESGVRPLTNSFLLDNSSTWLVNVNIHNKMNSDATAPIEFVFTNTDNEILNHLTTPMVGGDYTTSFSELIITGAGGYRLNVAARSEDTTNMVGGYTIIFQRVA